jgi:hypothetical protein
MEVLEPWQITVIYQAFTKNIVKYIKLAHGNKALLGNNMDKE